MVSNSAMPRHVIDNKSCHTNKEAPSGTEGAQCKLLSLQIYKLFKH